MYKVYSIKYYRFQRTILSSSDQVENPFIQSSFFGCFILFFHMFLYYFRIKFCCLLRSFLLFSGICSYVYIVLPMTTYLGLFHRNLEFLNFLLCYLYYVCFIINVLLNLSFRVCWCSMLLSDFSISDSS